MEIIQMMKNALAVIGTQKEPTVLELRQKAKELGIKNFGRMRKSDLIIAINEILIQNENSADDSESLSENSTETSQVEPDYRTSDEQPKVLHNEWANGTAEESTRMNCALIKACDTAAELSLLLKSAKGGTLARIYEAYGLMPYPYGGEKNSALQIRDFVEYEFRKREGNDILPLQPDLLIDALPQHDSSSIEKIARENLDVGIQSEIQRVHDFVRDLAIAGCDYNAYIDVIRHYDGVRYSNKSRDGFINTFKMIFLTHNDMSLAVNITDCLRNDSVLRDRAKDKISFWKKQYAGFEPCAQNEKILQSLILARFDAWLEVIERYDAQDEHDEQDEQDEREHDYIDVDFVDVTDQAHDDNLPPNEQSITIGDWMRIAESMKETEDEENENEECENEARSVETPITRDDWRRIAEAVRKEHHYISDFRQRIFNKKYAHKRKRNIPTRKSELLPGQITIQFNA